MPSSDRSSTIVFDSRPHRIIRSRDVLGDGFAQYPHVLRLLAENVARTVSEEQTRDEMLSGLKAWIDTRSSNAEVHYLPGRLLMHDTTSTPALVDMAAMRDGLAAQGVDPRTISPTLPVEVSVDHSLAVEAYATPDAPERNIQMEIRRNRERYRFLKWASANMDNIHINPPGTGIMHTINLEQLATVVTTEMRDGIEWIIPDQMLGTDSHTPMVNGLGVLGWGVGGLEAETVMFGMPTTLKIPEVVGVRLTGALPPGVMATDLALVVTHRLRELGVTGEFVEFFGPGVSTLSVGDRAVIANMAPEYGATTGYFPIDDSVVDYLAATGRPQWREELVRDYAQAADLWFDPTASPEFTREIHVDLSQISLTAAGPRRPQDQLPVSGIRGALEPEIGGASGDGELPATPVAIASITSCTNTTDPRLILAAGLLARNARARGLSPAPWVKTSLAPGSPAAMSYLSRSGLDTALSSIGFDIVGFGCATCIGNSGPLPEVIDESRRKGTIRPVAMLSGNRNFPSRVHPDLDLGFLMSPPMVIAYALAGDASVDVTTEPLGYSPEGDAVYLSDLWPSADEIDHVLSTAVDPQDFHRDFTTASNNRLWQEIDAPTGPLFPWDPDSTILRPPPFAVVPDGRSDRHSLGTIAAHPLLVLGDDITTDHISPASAIPQDSFVADFLVERGEDRSDLNVFASRRGNWEVMARGAFHSKAVHNALLNDVAEPGVAMTVYGPTGEVMRIWDAACRYKGEGRDVVVIAGDRYGMGSSRDWAAKVQQLLGVRAVLASSYERIHRSNLIGMGILPLEVPADIRERLASVSASSVITIHLDVESLSPRESVAVEVAEPNGSGWKFEATAAVLTTIEVEQLRSGGVIPMILDSARSEDTR